MDVTNVTDLVEWNWDVLRMKTWFYVPLVCLACSVGFDAGAEEQSYDFRGENFCLVEDARGIWSDGDPRAFNLEGGAKSFKLTMGGVSGSDRFYIIMEGVDSTLNAAYAAFENVAMYHSVYYIGYTWLSRVDSTARICNAVDSRPGG